METRIQGKADEGIDQNELTSLGLNDGCRNIE